MAEETARWGFVSLRQTQGSGRWTHWLALLSAAATLPLIFVGGLVTSHHAGLAVPDWPTSYGYNMFLFPWSKWVGGIRYEHPHRLLGSLLGILVMGLTFRVLFHERKDRRLRILVLLALGLVVLQGNLGGYRVLLLSKTLAIFHGCLGQIVFCYLAAIALMTSNGWSSGCPKPEPDRLNLRKWTAAFTLLVFIQLLLGATMRHTDSGLAVPDFPRMYGSWVPPLNPASLEAINQERIWHWDLEPVASWQIGLHLAHRAGGFLVLLAAFLLALKVFRHLQKTNPLFQAALVLSSLVFIQFGLGISVIWTQKAADIATAHVAVGALILMMSVLMTLLSFKRFAPAAVRVPLEDTCEKGILPATL